LDLSSIYFILLTLYFYVVVLVEIKENIMAEEQWKKAEDLLHRTKQEI